ncbi:MAG TPA: AmmeMemoRadiSam system radical SAM enzyme [Anaeromyxobacter sp.]|nr:AmmeMemoRadiSam system radical SAM enzyme [Anaeromyxobacter sp.]
MDDRRRFLKRCLAGGGAAALGLAALDDLLGPPEPLGLGFRNDAAGPLDAFSRPAAWSRAEGSLVRCELCPHRCVLAENDRGFCRARAVKGGRLHTLAYGNLCSAQLDPIEKKPLYHFLPRTPILSVAMGGCNLRCLNCQNWEISQARPADVKRVELLPEDLVALAAGRGIRALAFTYSEPLVTFEYVRDAAGLARAAGIRTVLVTAGFAEEGPLRELARVVDAVTLDVKSFRERAYRELAGARLAPVLRTLEVLREEGVWVEASFLMVTGLTDAPDEAGRFAAWLARALGPGTPLHLLRFFPAHRLQARPPTPLPALEAARARSLDAGLRFVYLGNVPGSGANDTRCPRCGRTLVAREGFVVRRLEVAGGRCPCGEVIPGVFA